MMCMAKKKLPNRTGKQLNLWIDETLRQQVEGLAKKNRRKLKEEVSIALEEYLQKQGLWPPPADGVN